jgi:D-alanyl-D-alanine carboxypeptidase
MMRQLRYLAATLCAAVISASTLAARGASPAAFEARCIPPGSVAPRSNTDGIFRRRALPDGRIAPLGAARDLHHGLLVHVQERVLTGPPPGERAAIDAVVKALSGDAGGWEAMAAQRFAPELLAGQTAAQRADAFERLRTDFGSIKTGRIMRRGPDAPVEIQITGSSGVDGTITLDLTDEDPPRVRRFGVDIGKAAGGRGGEPAAGALPHAPITAAMSPDQMRAPLERYLAALVKEDRFAGVVLIARDGQPVFQQAFGLADRANGRANTTATRFNIGSINKSFTQLAIGQLVAAGRVALTDPLGKFFPDYPQAVSRAATIEQLLNHRGGIADFFGPAFSAAAKDRFRSNADYFRLVGSLPPLFAPGAKSQYCNGCYIALGAIVEQVSGMPYERYIADKVFAPAGMAHAGFLQTDAIEPDLANGYTRRVDGATAGLRSNVMLHGSSGSAAGGSYATAADLLAFVNARRDGRLPRDSGMMQVAGGAPGTNASLQTEGRWTVVVLSNLDPPSGEQVGEAIMAPLAAAASGSGS